MMFSAGGNGSSSGCFYFRKIFQKIFEKQKDFFRK